MEANYERIEKVWHNLGANGAPSSGVLRTGLCTGAVLIIAMFGSLVAANRCPALEPYAFERNAVSCSFFALLMLTPVFRFLTNPLRAFASSMIAWLIFTAGYDLASLFFKNLFQALRLTPFQVLIEGTVVYAILGTSSWLVQMAWYARHHPVKRGRKLPAIPVRHVR